MTFFIITQDTHILPLTKKLTLIFKTLYKIRNIEKKKNPFFFQEFEKNFEIAIFVPDKNSDIFSFFLYFFAIFLALKTVSLPSPQIL